jgi:hypothetical protein
MTEFLISEVSFAATKPRDALYLKPKTSMRKKEALFSKIFLTSLAASRNV